MYYSASQWLLFFFIYCFCGWVWETAYVSIRTRELVNRGFMHGPFLPIYGSGAMVILLSTIGVRENLVLIYIFGMVSSTVLEYFTGASMEKLFHVRYWDYSKHHFNLNGHICLFVSLAWGAFSILLVRVLHPPIETLVLAIPTVVTDISAFALTAYMAVDMTISVNEALDLKATLIRLAESNEEIRKLQNRVDFVAALAEDDLRKFKAEQEQKKRKFKERFAENLQEARERQMAYLDRIGERVREYFTSIEENADSLKEYMEILEDQRRKLIERPDRDYARSSRILRRNPGAVSKHYKEELDNLIGMLKK